MAGDEDISELIGRLQDAQRQGFHLTPGTIRLVLTALRFYLAARSWLAKPLADRHDDAPRKAPDRPTGPPATIGDMRRHGLVACTIQCDGPSCWNSKRVLFDALALDDGTTFTTIPARRAFRCENCGCRRVRVSPDWTDHQAQGSERRRRAAQETKISRDSPPSALNPFP